MIRPTALYRPGHDARHAAAVGRALIAAGHADPALLVALPTPALAAKATAMLDRHLALPAARPTALPTQAAGATRVPAVQPLTEVPAGDSKVQRDAETVLLAALSASIGVPLAPARIHLPDGTHVEVDGVSEDPAVIAEVWAHQGSVRGAQVKKVLADAFKMLHVVDVLGPKRMILCFSDPQAARNFREGKTWYASALRNFGIEVHVVDLDTAWRERIVAAQTRQYR